MARAWFLLLINYTRKGGVIIASSSIIRVASTLYKDKYPIRIYSDFLDKNNRQVSNYNY